MLKNYFLIITLSFLYCHNAASWVRALPSGKLSLENIFGDSSRYQALFLNTCRKQIEASCLSPDLKGKSKSSACLKHLFEGANSPQKNIDPVTDGTDCGILLNLASGLIEQ